MEDQFMKFGTWCLEQGPGKVLEVLIIIGLIRYVPKLIEAHISFIDVSKSASKALATGINHMADAMGILARNDMLAQGKVKEAKEAIKDINV